jgi:hypothetical protein
MVKSGVDGIRCINLGSTENSNWVEDSQFINKIKLDAKRIRGEVISGAVDVEGYLQSTISKVFFNFDKDKRDIFNNTILDKDFFTFNEKQKTMNKLIDAFPEIFFSIDKEKKGDLNKKIEYVKEHRNIFAHNEIIINLADKTAYFERNGEKYPITDEFLVQFKQCVSSIEQYFVPIWMKLADSRKNKKAK